MIRFLQLIWHGCWHVWYPVAAARYYETDEFGGTRKGSMVYVTCRKCGRRTHFKDAAMADCEKEGA